MFASALAVQAQDVNGDGHVTYLVPLNVPNAVVGALGSQWRTELWVHNGAKDPYNIQGCPAIVLDPIQLCDFVPFHAPGVTEKAYPYETGENSPGAFTTFTFSLYPWQSGVIVRSRLYELSRHAQPTGVEIPIVPEDEFFTKQSRFIGIPNNSTIRVALRVYDPMHMPGSAVRVEIFDESGNAIAATILPLIPQTIDAISPGYGAILDVASAFPQLASVGRFDIRLTPLVDVMFYWALVSVTDQNTQTVLLVTAGE